MPDFDLEQKRAAQAEARHNAAIELDVAYQPTREERVQAIVECELCDDDGYRGAMVCDHIDHHAATVRGRAAVRAELEKLRARRGDQS